MLGGCFQSRRYIAALSLTAVVIVLAFAASRPSTQRNAFRWAPVKMLHGCANLKAGCGRHSINNFDAQPASEDDWDFGAPGPAGAHAAVKSADDELIADEESFVLNQLVPGMVGRVPTTSSRSSVIAQKQLLERLFQHEMGLPEGRLRRAVSYGGNNERLQRALHKLIRGDPVTVATVGGSVTAGVGALTQNLAYRERLFYWIRKTFPNTKHVFANGALAAAPSSYMSQCIHDYAPLESDLVFVEFTMNDGQNSCEVTTDGRRGFEVLMRKLLKYPRGPAVVVLHWWSPVTQRFWASPEDQLDVFSKFYGLPSLSWRDAVHDLIATNATGFTVADLYFDKGHPNGYNGHRYFSDIISAFLRNEAAFMLLNGLDASAEVKSVDDLAPLPEPMFEGNYEGKSQCLRGQGLQDAAITSDGWDWQNDGSGDRPKWGYVSWRAGHKLLIMADTLTYRGNSKILIGIGTLKSYEHMGMAELTCVSGCECEPKTLDGHWKQKTSQTEWEYHAVTQARDCVVAVSTLNETTSGEHKFVVNSLLVTDLHESATRWFSHIDELKDHAERQRAKQAAAEKAAADETTADGSTIGDGRQSQQGTKGNGGAHSDQHQQQQQKQQQQQQQQQHRRDSQDQQRQQKGGDSGGGAGRSEGDALPKQLRRQGQPAQQQPSGQESGHRQQQQHQREAEERSDSQHDKRPGQKGQHQRDGGQEQSHAEISSESDERIQAQKQTHKPSKNDSSKGD